MHREGKGPQGLVFGRFWKSGSRVQPGGVELGVLARQSQRGACGGHVSGQVCSSPGPRGCRQILDVTAGRNQSRDASGCARPWRSTEEHRPQGVQAM